MSAFYLTLLNYAAAQKKKNNAFFMPHLSSFCSLTASKYPTFKRANKKIDFLLA